MSVEAKAHRLVTEHRVHFHGVSVDGEPVLRWQVEGDSGTYQVVADTYGINCDCPSRTRCSHQIAVVLWARHYGIAWRLTGNIVDDVVRDEETP